jgi:hypothetical protein
MITYLVQTVGGSGILPAAAMLIFMAGFVTIVVRTAGIDRNRIKRLSRLPLDDIEKEGTGGDDSLR